MMATTSEANTTYLENNTGAASRYSPACHNREEFEASQARHELVPPQEIFASQIVVTYFVIYDIVQYPTVLLVSGKSER